jgi:CubicO group peptidase (beta-lactamase class C family)
MACSSVYETSRRSMLLAAAGTLFLSSTRALAAPWPGPALTQASPQVNDALDSGAGLSALRAVAVARDGQLVTERFYGGASPNALFRINSATKSVISILTGIALTQGKLRSVSQTLGELLPEAAAAHPDSAATAVTLRQVLTGTTGLAYDWTKQFKALSVSPDPVHYAFALARDTQAGGTWSYNDAAIGLLTPVLERAYGMQLIEVARLNLFRPLGIDEFEWQRDLAGRALAYGGLRLQVRDMLKIAWMMADGGRWQGAQVVPADWVVDSTRRQVGGAWPNPPIDDSGYGYLWFTGTYKDLPVAWAWGYGAQFALFAPSLRLAVVTLATEPPPQQLAMQNRGVASLIARLLDSFA